MELVGLSYYYGVGMLILISVTSIIFLSAVGLSCASWWLHVLLIPTKLSILRLSSCSGPWKLMRRRQVRPSKCPTSATPSISGRISSRPIWTDWMSKIKESSASISPSSYKITSTPAGSTWPAAQTAKIYQFPKASKNPLSSEDTARLSRKLENLAIFKAGPAMPWSIYPRKVVYYLTWTQAGTS